MSSLTSLALTLSALGASLALAGPALADGGGDTPLLVMVDQNRGVSGSATAEDDSGPVSDSEVDMAPGFGPYVAAASASASIDAAFGQGGGNQNSIILDDRIVARGAAFANGEGYDFDGFGSGSGQSFADFVFSVPVATTYSLTGNIAAFDSGEASLLLWDGMANEVFSANAFGPSERVPVNFSGPLPADTYTLRLLANGSAFGDFSFFDYAFAEFDITLQLGPDEPGTGFCFGQFGCPCNNNDSSGIAGCVNSTGSGARLTGSGSASYSANDLVLTAEGFPAGESGLFFMGGTTFSPVDVGDGLGCTGGLFRFLPSTVSTTGELCLDDIVGAAPAGTLGSGVTRHFQAWTRDVLCGPPPAPCPSPCGMNSNLSNGYSVLFTP